MLPSNQRLQPRLSRHAHRRSPALFSGAIDELTIMLFLTFPAKTNSRRKDGSYSILHVPQLRNTADPTMVATGGLEPPT